LIHPTSTFLCDENLPKCEKKGMVKALLEINGFQKNKSPYFDLNEAHDAIHEMHGVDSSLLALQGTHPSSPHFTKQQLIIVIFHLPLLDVTNFIMA
jgi:hypothetical protein